MTQTEIHVRKPRLDFERPIDRFYLGGNPIRTHLFNALNLTFPEGERFFVKAVHDHRKDVHDPLLLRDVRAFAEQEGQHAHQHERFFGTLRAQGYVLDEFEARFLALARYAKDLPRWLRLTITAGAEHYTASLAALLLEHQLLEGCDETMRDLITWHAIEEIEHKHVAYDLLVRAYPRNYFLRVWGFIVATWVIWYYVPQAYKLLMKQDRAAGRLDDAQLEAARRELREEKEQRFRRALRGVLLRYFVPGFHPSQQDDRAILARYAPTLEPILASKG
ncbi:MAG: metal-dependent hydrolase [Polyangiales bacterium]